MLKLLTRDPALSRLTGYRRAHVTVLSAAQLRCTALIPAAARLLDDIHPNWFAADRVDLTTLDVADPFRCVLAQVYGGYAVGLGVIHDALSCRSIAADLDDAFSSPASTAAWRAEIVNRRAVTTLAAAAAGTRVTASDAC